MSSGPVVLRTKFFVFNFKLILCGALTLFSQLSASASENVTLIWNPSDDPAVVGYKIYCGTASRSYSDVVTVGNTNSATLSGLVVGTTYYFAASSYDGAGNESAWSDEASYTVPSPLPALTSAVLSGGQFSFTLAGVAGQAYVVQASTNLLDWIPVQTNTAPFTFVDAKAAGFSRRFYRARSASL